MSREIKFRAWDKEEKIMYSWQYLLYTLCDFFEDPLLILMQFTGLRDKNGKEAYHKDFYRRSDGQVACIRNFIEDTYHLIDWVRSGGTFEIIGNLDEKPELIEEPK